MSCEVAVVEMPRIAWRVVCGLLDVIATLSPTRALVSVDLPALGRPTRQAKPARYAAPRALSLSSPGVRLLLMSAPSSGVCRRLYKRNIPACGINIGTFGFLADIELSELENKLEKILQGKYKIAERLMISGFVRSGETERFLGHAINAGKLVEPIRPRLVAVDLRDAGHLAPPSGAFGIVDEVAAGGLVAPLDGSEDGLGEAINDRLRRAAGFVG